MNKAFYLIVFFLSVQAFAENVLLEANAQGIEKMDIAILPFAAQSPGETRKPFTLPEGVIENDLLLSGRFKVLRTDKYDSVFMSQKNLPIYMDGAYSFKRDEISLTCNLYEARSRELMVGKKYEGAEKTLRTMMHRFSDEVVMTMFGEKGIALSRIVYVRKEGNAKEIYAMDYDGYNHDALTGNKSINLFPSFSPDNKEVVFISYKNGKPNLYTLALYNRQMRTLTQNNALNSSPEWCKIENSIVYASSTSGNTEIYIRDPKEGGAVKLTDHWGIDTSPTWSPNGYEIAFTSDRMGNPQIFIMDVEGANVRRLTFQGKYNDSPAWSPKGDRIAYSSLGESVFDICTITPNGEDVKVLTKGGNNEYPAWSPDGRHIAFARSHGGKSDIFIMNDDGSEQRQITFSGNCFMPAWSNF